MAILNREEFLDSLQIVKPAIPQKSSIITCLYYWFDGNYIYGFDGNVGLGIRVPFKLPEELRCGLPGELLIKFVEQNENEQINLDIGDNESSVKVSIGNARLELSSLDYEQCPWPSLARKSNDYKRCTITKNMITALELVTVSCEAKFADPPEMLGVTFELNQDETELQFYCTDGKTVSSSKIIAEDGLIGDPSLPRLIVPLEFAKQISALYKSGEATISFFDDIAVCELEKGPLLFAGILEFNRPLDMGGIVDQAKDLTYSKIPARLKDAVNNAVLVVGNQATEFAVEETKAGLVLFITADNGVHQFDDKIGVEHPISRGMFNPELVKRAIPNSNEMAFNESNFVMRGPLGFVHLISAVDK